MKELQADRQTLRKEVQRALSTLAARGGRRFSR